MPCVGRSGIVLATLALISSTAVAQPANDDCANATVLSVGSLPFGELVDTAAATNDGDVLQVQGRRAHAERRPQDRPQAR